MDGVTAEHLKKQLKEYQKKLELERKVNAKVNGALNINGDLESLKKMLAQKEAQLTRLNERYEASRERVSKLAKERDQFKTTADTKHRENNQIKERTQSLIQKTKEQLKSTFNETKHWRDEAMKLGQANRKLRQREAKEVELNEELQKEKKKNKHLHGEVEKYKKRYKDLKLQIDSAGPGNLTLRSRRNKPRGRPRKNEQSIYVSTDSSTREEIDATVDFLQALEEEDRKNDDSVGNIDIDNNNDDNNKNNKKYKKPYRKYQKQNYKKGGYKKGRYYKGRYKKGGYGKYKRME